MSNLSNKLFIDIETTMNRVNINNDLLEKFRQKYLPPMSWSKDEIIERYQEELENKSPLLAEFGKIVCVSVWYVNSLWESVLNSYCWDNEFTLLCDLYNCLKKAEWYTIIWHNVKYFDIPFLTKRMRIHNIQIPKIIDFFQKKPREINVHDTMDMWRWLWTKEFSSLESVCLALWIDNPKANVNGSSVRQLELDGKYNEIASYCEWDVRATMEVYKRLIPRS